MTKCRFYLRVRRVDGLWSVQPGCWRVIHNHFMDDTLELQEKSRQVVQENIGLVESLAHGGRVSAGGIARTLVDGFGETVRAVDVANAARAPRTFAETMAAIDALIDNVRFSGEKDVERTAGGQKLRNLFWCLLPALRMFKNMPFVIAMDSTYATNQFGMPLLLFVRYYRFSPQELCSGRRLSRG